MKNLFGMGVKSYQSQRFSSNLRACFFNYAVEASAKFPSPYFWKGATQKPLKLPILYMLSVKAGLLFSDITN